VDYLKKTIFTTIWDYKQAGILDPTIDKDKLLLTNFFKSNAIQSSEKKIDHRNLEYQIDKKIINQQYHSLDNTNQNLIDNDLILEVENLANSSKDIPSLENNITNFKKFHSLKGSNKLLFGAGNSKSKTLFISEPPSYEEELQQKPYVEESNELFEKIIESMGLIPLNKNNCNIFVIPATPFRFVKNTDDKISDLELMRPFLKKYIELISPKFLIFISKIPASILGLTDFLKFDSINGGFIGEYLGIPTVEIEGMKSMINDPEKKRNTWNNLKLIIQLINKENEH
tara:strand:+ start:243 stop:1097 length:855 start_codon:yes stop_codon:yes gene_type:complete